jgi:pyruvate formate lyase activating enzyme
MKEALFYKKLKENVVQCQLCPHFCTLKDEELGKCGVRKNTGGKLHSLVYEKPCSLALDPIEKKPFYHFLPGQEALSIATVGCNLKCKFCQNCEISQARPEQIYSKNISPEDIIGEAKQKKVKIIAYTYTEPTIFYEYMLDIAKLAKKAGIKNVIVSNGFINPAPLKELCKYIDAANIDLKGIEDSFYKNICEARVAPVLETLKILKKEKVWLEITNLIIPTLNDSEKDIKKLVDWVTENLGKENVLHFTAFYPQYQLSHLTPTSPRILEKARKIALDAGLKYVYTGNIQDNEGNNTYCPKCKKPLIKRRLFSITENNLKKGCCTYCDEKIGGVWD